MSKDENDNVGGAYNDDNDDDLMIITTIMLLIMSMFSKQCKLNMQKHYSI